MYFTLGTQFNVESGDLFSRVVTGLGALDANILVTVGHQIDPAELGCQPSHVRVERFVPQGEVLPWCDVVVFHGGSGTLTGVLAHGLPMILLAMGADQPANADRCQALGVGVSLDPARATPSRVAATVMAVLADPTYRQAAQRVQTEMAAQPEPASAVAALERLAVGRRPPDMDDDDPLRTSQHWQVAPSRPAAHLLARKLGTMIQDRGVASPHRR